MKTNRRIIIVDDNPAIHEDIKSVLSPSGSSVSKELEALESELFGEEDGSANSNSKLDFEYEIDSAFQGEEAIEKVTKANEEGNPYAMCFMDVRMPPGIDGIETIKRIWEKVPDIQVVICTAYSDYSWDQIIDKLSKTDNLLFLKKPFESAAVQQMALSLTEKWNINNENKALINSLEDKVQQRTEELEAARAKTVYASKMASLGEMAGGIAHEINNPLTVVITSAELLMDLIEDGEAEKEQLLNYSKKIMNMGDRISKIVRSLKNLTRRSSDDPFESTLIKTIIDDTMELCNQKIKQNQIEFIYEPVADDLSIECRGSEISQTLLNLISNSVDAIEKNESKWIELKIEDKGDNVTFMVTDSGDGIPSEVREKILQPFFTTKEVGKGTGLGLPISKGLVEAHNGQFEIDMDHKHTCFIITLPKKHVDKKQAA